LPVKTSGAVQLTASSLLVLAALSVILHV
jgi:hypothetical protein